MSGRPFTEQERLTVEAVCREFGKEHRVKVGHRFSRPDDVVLWIQGQNRSVASGLYTALLDASPSFVTIRFAMWLTLERMWRV